MRGRKPKPTILHILHGTWRRDRHGEKPDWAIEAAKRAAAAVEPPGGALEPLEAQAAARQRRRRQGGVGPPDGA
jgi:hypothetical protein